MTTSSKLTYLNTTKQLLKTEINKINNVLDDNSTFRSYPQELFNGYLDVLNNGTDTLWNNLEKVSASGEEATLENVETAPIKMVLNGNTSQDTTSGKNIFNYTRTEKTITKNGVTSTINDDGSITLDGTATALIWFVLNSAFNWESGDYTMYLTDKKIDSFILFSDVGATDTIKQINVATTITKNISLRIEPNTSFNNLTFFPMILKGKYTLENIGDYEPYTGGQPSPSPDYPQEVKVVKGENVVSVQGKNLLDTSNARNDKTWLTRNSDGSLTLNYPSGSNVNFTDLFENNINIPTDNYILKIFMEGTFVGGNLIVKNTNGNYIRQTPIRNGNAITITNSDIGNIQFYVVSAGTNCTIKLELEKGTPTSYVPYSKTDYPINLISKNLLTGTFRQGNSSGDPINRRIFADDNYYVEKGKTYILSTNLDVSQFNYALNISWDNFPTSVIFDSKWLTLNQYIFTAKMSGHIGIPVRKADESALTPTDIQDVWFKLEETIYGEETSLELCKINTYKDYFHKDNGKWYVHKEIGKKVLDGSESWYISGQAFKVVNFLPLASSGYEFDSIDKIAYCNYFQQQTPDSIYTNGTLGFGIQSYGKSLYAARTSSVSTVEQFKTWLSTHNTIVYYVLATPTEEEITNSTLIEQLEAISKAKSVKDKTYITQTNDELPFILDVEAIKEYEVN